MKIVPFDVIKGTHCTAHCTYYDSDKMDEAYRESKNEASEQDEGREQDREDAASEDAYELEEAVFVHRRR